MQSRVACHGCDQLYQLARRGNCDLGLYLEFGLGLSGYQGEFRQPQFGRRFSWYHVGSRITLYATLRSRHSVDRGFLADNDRVPLAESGFR
jgi:hypothetical protein